MARQMAFFLPLLLSRDETNEHDTSYWREYKGCEYNTTESGRPCANWDDVLPLDTVFNQYEPGGSGGWARYDMAGRDNNFCRNYKTGKNKYTEEDREQHTQVGAWCYVQGGVGTTTESMSTAATNMAGPEWEMCARNYNWNPPQCDLPVGEELNVVEDLSWQSTTCYCGNTLVGYSGTRTSGWCFHFPMDWPSVSGVTQYWGMHYYPSHPAPDYRHPDYGVSNHVKSKFLKNNGGRRDAHLPGEPIPTQLRLSLIHI